MATDEERALGRARVGLIIIAVLLRIAYVLDGQRLPFVAALALYVVYGLPFFYETKWMSETLGLFLLTASLVVDSAQFHSTTAAEATPAHARAVVFPQFVAGALLGLATLARVSLVPVLPFSILALLLVRRVSGEGGCSRLSGRSCWCDAARGDASSRWPRCRSVWRSRSSSSIRRAAIDCP